MAFDYAAAALTAKSLVENFGGSGLFVIKGATGGEDINGDPIADEPDTTISGTITPLLQYKQKEVDGTNVLMGDSYVFFNGDSVPDNAITTVNGKEFRAVKSTALTSVDGVRIYQKIQVRA